MSPFLATFITFALALGWLRLMDFAAHRGWVESRLSRKLIHIGTGPIFVLCWLIFPDVWYSRWLAALVPFAIVVQFALVGLGVMKDPKAVEAMSRTGDPREILRGPLYYGIMFVLLTVVFWKDSPVGIVALMMMCGGDGLADIVGRRVKSAKLPHSPNKSVAGTLSVFFGGWTLSLLILAVYVAVGVFPPPLNWYLLPVSLIALAATIVESLPFSDIDNITMTLTAVLVGWFLF